MKLTRKMILDELRAQYLRENTPPLKDDSQHAYDFRPEFSSLLQVDEENGTTSGGTLSHMSIKKDDLKITQS